MIRAGLTGASGSGKSTVCALLEKEGIPCLDTDLVARKVTSPSSPCLKELAGSLGREILLPDGSLDRKKTAAIAFSDEKKYAALNRITHSHIVPVCLNWLDEKEKEGYAAAVLDAPLLFEAGLEKEVDCVLAVVSPLPFRVSRLTQRDGIDEASVLLRLSRQHSDPYYLARSDLMIVNDCDGETLSRRVRAAAVSLLSFRRQ